MLNRRALLGILGKTTAASVAFGSGFAGTPLFAIVRSSTPVAAQSTSTTYDIQLDAAMTKLSTRVYSEEGIPMILACEDLTAKTPVPPLYSKPMNDAVAPAFQKYLDSWGRLHPNAPSGDVAKLVELLSYRDFADGGKDDNL